MAAMADPKNAQKVGRRNDFRNTPIVAMPPDSVLSNSSFLQAGETKKPASSPDKLYLIFVPGTETWFAAMTILSLQKLTREGNSLFIRKCWSAAKPKTSTELSRRYS
jgi:hypothetical protein